MARNSRSVGRSGPLRVLSTCQTSQYPFSPAGVMTLCCRVGGTVGAGQPQPHAMMSPEDKEKRSACSAAPPAGLDWQIRQTLKVQSSCQIQFFLKSGSRSHHSNVWSKGFFPSSQFGFSQFGCCVCFIFHLEKKDLQHFFSSARPRHHVHQDAGAAQPNSSWSSETCCVLDVVFEVVLMLCDPHH